MMEFHISREARDRYEFNQTLFAFNGNVVFANLRASREFAFRMNERGESKKTRSGRFSRERSTPWGSSTS